MTFARVDEQLLLNDQGVLWELFHENSKTSHHERNLTYGVHPSDAVVVRMMNRLRRVKPYSDRPKIPLPAELATPKKAFDEILLGRATARGFSGGAIPIGHLAKILAMSYGVTRDNRDTVYPRPFRIVPSGGALYPLEIYLHVRCVENLPAGLYHYDPEDAVLDALRPGDESPAIADFFVQPDLAGSAAVILFVSGVFYRSTFKYGDRGYRFVLLEAGHLVQNAILTVESLGLAAASIGGYLDREVDRFLGFDGVSESTVYVLMIGEGADGERRSNGTAAGQV